MVRAFAPLLIAMGAAASAAPPPPPEYPRNLPKEAGGFQMESIYPIYHSWLLRQRKEALLAALPNTDEWQERRLWHRIIESEIHSYDFGIIRADRLDRFCEGNWIRDEKPGRCSYRYSYAIVPGSPWNDPALNKAIADGFRPAELAGRLTALNWKPSYSDWGDETLLVAFAAHVDAKKFYAPMVRVASVSTDACPALGTAIGGLGKVTINLGPDAITRPVDVMAPHGARTEVSLTVANEKGEAVVLKGATPLHDYLAPIWAAIESCAPSSK